MHIAHTCLLPWSCFHTLPQKAVVQELEAVGLSLDHMHRASTYATVLDNL